MKPLATDFGEVHLPPTDPRYVDGASGGRVPDVSGLNVDAARKRLKDAGFRVADQPNWVNSYEPSGAVVGTTPSGQIIPGSTITITISNGIAPPPPPAPVQRGPVIAADGPSNPDQPPQGGPLVIQIPGLPPIVLGPPPPPEPPG
jgi:beta-lactam-binding protein with PASTA domain